MMFLLDHDLGMEIELQCVRDFFIVIFLGSSFCLQSATDDLGTGSSAICLCVPVLFVCPPRGVRPVALSPLRFSHRAVTLYLRPV